MSLRLALGLLRRKDTLLVCLLGPIILGVMLGGVIDSILKILKSDLVIIAFLPMLIMVFLGMLYYSNTVITRNQSSLEEENDSGKITLHKFKAIFLGSTLILVFYIAVFLFIGLTHLYSQVEEKDLGVNITEVGILPTILSLGLLIVLTALILAIISLVVFKILKPRELYKPNSNIGVVDILLVFCLCELGYAVIGSVLTPILGEAYSYLGLISFGIIPILYLRANNLNIREELRFNQPKVKYILIGLLLWAAATLLEMLLIEGIIYIYPDVVIGLPDTDSLFKGNLIGNILITAVTPAIFEEILFRGFMLGILLKLIDPKAAIIITSILFGLSHMHPIVIISATLSGLVMGYMFHKSKSIIVPVIIHFINNLLAILFNNFVQ
ncbi:MAG: type II CAAX endopeptidase family protein [Clostridium sp.]